MYDKTSSLEFKKFGSTYKCSKINDENLLSKKIITTSKIVSSLYKFCDYVYIELEEGLANIIVYDKENEFKVFGVHRHIEINPEVSFNIIPITPEASFNLIIKKECKINIEFLDYPYVYKRILPTINILEIISYYYTIKSPNYKFDGERHNLYELTFVDNGILNTTVDGIEYKLEPYDLIIYGKNQFHTQSVENNFSCSYLTILFDMKIEDANLICNRVFHCRKSIYKYIRDFAKNSSSDIEKASDLMIINLQQIIVSLFQYDKIQNDYENIPKETYKQFQNELLNDILKYIDDTICENITIDNICMKFTLSRSSLQIIFKEHLDISPKKYINNLKLEKGKLLIKENKYTISEIASILGFSSIHYFSRAFTQKYKISPSEYSQKIF